LLILPSWLLFSSTCVMFMSYFTAVVNLGEVLAEAAVAGDRDNRPIGRGGPRAHRGGKPKPIEPR